MITLPAMCAMRQIVCDPIAADLDSALRETAPRSCVSPDVGRGATNSIAGDTA